MQLYNSKTKKQFYTVKNYPISDNDAINMGLSGTKNKEVRAMTIAAFSVTQNNRELSKIPMRKKLLKFLMANSDSAIRHWKQKGYIIENNNNYHLTDNGLDVCKKSLNNKVGAYSTSKEKVDEWINRMLKGDEITVSKKF